MSGFRFGDRVITVMGIVNVTPDSFSDGGPHATAADAIAHGLRLSEQGADIIDVGGESTRPGAAPVDIDVERNRVVPVVAGLARRGVPVSIDSRHPAVVSAALDAGASVVNDVGGLRLIEMIELCAAADAAAVAMHMPSADLEATHSHDGYDDVVADVCAFLAAAARRAMSAGVPEVVLDPGLGFGKSADDNAALVRGLGALGALGHPVMAAASRKRFVGALSGVEQPAARDEASVIVHLAAVANGATVLRVHDVARHRQALRIWSELRA